jgi:hypothetical protein
VSAPGRELPYRGADRAEHLARLVCRLDARAAEADTKRALDPPTLALLDAWATVEAVIDFYQERIAAEGFLSTALEPGSILALAALLGHGPRPPLAAGVHLAYQLNADPADSAVALGPGMLAMSVPGEGEQPQTFETLEELVARPSWNTLAVALARPLSTTRDTVAHLRRLVIAGTAAALLPNDVILLDLAGEATPVHVSVASAEVDHTAGLTTVELLSDVAAPAPAPSAAAVVDALGALEPQLRRPPSLPPRSPEALVRSPADVFGPSSDTTPRLLGALEPALGQTLYQALATTTIGEREVTSASVLTVKAAPFGAQAAPRPLFDDTGKPAGTDEWPLGGSHVLKLRIAGTGIAAALEHAVRRMSRDEGEELFDLIVELLEFPFGGREREHGDRPHVLAIDCATEEQSAGTSVRIRGEGRLVANLHPLGKLEISLSDGKAELEYTGPVPGAELLRVHITPNPREGAIDAVVNGHRYGWVPEQREPLRAKLGIHTLTITWRAAQRRERDHERERDRDSSSLELSIETPLPLTDTRRLDLDGVYDGILRDTPILIEAADDVDEEDLYPLVAIVHSTGTVAAARYGVTAKVTRLRLDRDWIGRERLLSTLRRLTVRAQPSALDLLPLPVDDDVGGGTIELDRLHAGLEAGRLLIITGTRSDLPSGAQVAAGEVVMVAEIRHGSEDAPGDAPRTTLTLATPLAYRYERRTVKLYGNVVGARQGASQREPLPVEGEGPRTLAMAPVLADPAPVEAGSTSSLAVDVDGIRYHEVPRSEDPSLARAYLTGTDSEGRTTVTFAAPLPTGTGSVTATYRAGHGADGNVRAHQVTQLLSRPLSVAGLDNPLPGSGGAEGDGPGSVRSRAPVGLNAVGRIVSISDHADLALSWVGIGKAVALTATDGRRERVLLTIADDQPVPLAPAGALVAGVTGAIVEAGDPLVPVTVRAADLLAIVLAADVIRAPEARWEDVATALRAALLDDFGYASRGLGEAVERSDLIATAHGVHGVRSFTVTALGLVGAGASAQEIADLPQRLTGPVPERLEVRLRPPADAPLAPAQVAFLLGGVRDTLLLNERPA